MKTKISKWITRLITGTALVACLGCSTFSEGGGRMGMTYESKHSVYFFNESDGDNQGNSSRAGIESTLVDKLVEPKPEPDSE